MMRESEATSDNVQPIIETDEAFLGVLETLDVGRIMACWSRSDEVSMLFPGADLAQGREEVRSAWEQVAGNTRHLKMVLEMLVVMRQGDMGWTFLSGTVASTHGDETLSVNVYVTNIYRREDGDWKLVHHHATPAPHQPSYLEQRLN